MRQRNACRTGHQGTAGNLVGLTVLRLAPVEAENKPLTGEEKHKQQLNTWGFQTIILILIVIAAIFGVLKNEIVLCVMAANISVAISLILAKLID